MRVSLSALALGFGSLLPLALARSAAEWATQASRAKDGIIKLDSQSYEELIAGSDREYSVTVMLTAMPAQFKCQPCHDFDPSFKQVASSWRRVPKDVRDTHFFASLDFADGQAVYQMLGLSSAPTVQFHPAHTGPNKSNKLQVVTYDMNRNGLGAPALHSWTQPLLPAQFALHKPFNPIPLIMTVLSLAISTALIATAYPYILPVIQSRVFWGGVSLFLILTFNSGYMWNKIKNAPYTQTGRDGQVSWIAGGFQNQLGMESQVVGAIYGLLAFCIVALTILVPAQTNPTKQRIGVYLWLGMLIVVFSLLFKLFKLKNGGYPFGLLF